MAINNSSEKLPESEFYRSSFLFIISLRVRQNSLIPKNKALYFAAKAVLVPAEV